MPKPTAPAKSANGSSTTSKKPNAPLRKNDECFITEARPPGNPKGRASIFASATIYDSYISWTPYPCIAVVTRNILSYPLSKFSGRAYDDGFI